MGIAPTLSDERALWRLHKLSCFSFGRIVGNDHVLNINQSAIIFACIVLVSFVVAVVYYLEDPPYGG